ncbi:alkylation response protein AidB-like acyl-CoA dehydrogenase [Streptosporangium becharense]|uniref:Alkylation response protein AidB-like acyl-CoA dehydrogenase n=1 Tax=Streptosporangium becharense TaxID=1816182 RepID=A0A7W9IN53_9ACTN|nr:acyl-CoA dehydrogenase family protein [Streptosporangium becharense]MBB2914556.1 alkylation response protein AidB-like acyl-CoA dehydrogenase [Streptosporangium becharense]MBB5823401.1 alkylation response protein AidB-like acyl-CoA dehydrogenase [Streptosporangium becharense]
MTLTDERRDFVAAIDDFCRREAGTREQWLKLTYGGATPHNAELYRKMAELGWLGVAVPEEYGGAGQSMVDLLLFLETTAYWQVPIGGFGTSAITAASYEKFGSQEQKRRVLGDFVSGAVLAVAMSEPGAGSDVGALTCEARRRDGGWVVNGQKTWCSNAHIADHILLVARTSTAGGKHDGLTMFSVPAGVGGLTVRGIDTMGGREVNDLYFTDCFLPGDAVVGQVDQAWHQLMAGLNLERMILAGLMLGTARRAFDDTVSYVRERRQFGRPVGSFQALRHRLADHATELECTRLLVHDVARRIEADPTRLLPREASMAKLKATEFAKAMALDGMQMMGGYGYATEYGMERLVRSTVVSTVYGGTSEIQRDIIGKTYGL